ncbi:MAG: F0F1 ATP synthase subunit delta [Pseudonocardiales bacterium]|nr:F0F1 ATP synthase subunit delta [Pseudonocardiales bacterium]MBV9028767.1 F0F1 ATP synthase subunit delta [Pseudonocardiales bacterium]MBW0011548.1 F0F1 ATP synthase subunit delta [Pseudonocardiales bacterium]
MQPASRAALAAARERLESRIGGAGVADRDRLGDDLGAVAAVLGEQPVIRRHLADSSAPEQIRRKMTESLFGGKVSRIALRILGDVVVSRWSRPLDLVDGVEELAWQALLALAERDRSLDDVEDELFRFGRILVAQPRLATLLGDESAPAAGRLELLDTVLAGRTAAVTRRLLEQAVRAPRRRPLEEIVEEFVDRAAARRERSVAYVTAAGPLSEQQEQRLVEILNRIYRRPISVKVDLDPALLGGLVIRVGDEVIDGSVAARLDQARQGISR